MDELTIGQVAQQMGLRASAIRYYEAEGLVPVGRRRDGRRIYDVTVLERLALIELAKGSGFTVGEIRKLLHGFARRTPPGERWRALADAKMKELDRRIAEARRMKNVLGLLARCKCPTLEDCGRSMLSRR